MPGNGARRPWHLFAALVEACSRIRGGVLRSSKRNEKRVSRRNVKSQYLPEVPFMAMVAAAITVERFAPRPERAARVTGVVVIAAGVLVIARALT